ncbi:protein FRA10AC1 homolog [Wyeomyia smithii]|uniref:protein FRA10AC1 homolog n=1 Tax=Wyeomyia smithii TaxID=174621 RepID=UPI002467D50C|nr:protein FRA10AC1 homolog [Wyeomyia smithii]
MSRRLAKLNPYELHKHLINEYVLTKPGTTRHLQRDCSRDKTDHDVIRENHRFLWDGEEVDSWEKQLAKKYYDKLFKEYCIADLSRYKENKVAMRWRIEKEVIAGKGQFTCGNRTCEERETLRSWEVYFAYQEHETRKNALVKLRLCPKCSDKLNYHSKKREIKRLKKRERSKQAQRCDFEAVEPERLKRTETGDGQDKGSTNLNESGQSSDVVGNDPGDQSGIPSSSSSLMENCWTKGPDLEEKSREEEFDDYLESLLL